VFAWANVAVRWFEYPAYPEYPQLWGAFTHGVSVLDLLFNCGPEAPALALLSRREKVAA
jgi:hypothetical protein